jgi:hypothetical protein
MLTETPEPALYVRTLIISTANKHGTNHVPITVIFANYSASTRKPTDRGLTNNRVRSAAPGHPQSQRTVTSQVPTTSAVATTNHIDNPNMEKTMGAVFAGVTFQTRGPMLHSTPLFHDPCHGIFSCRTLPNSQTLLGMLCAQTRDHHRGPDLVQHACDMYRGRHACDTGDFTYLVGKASPFTG